MKKLSVAEVRETFLTFFESKGCTREKSASLVPANDPTLLFTSAGMVQFKDVFTGNEKRAYTRATTAQKCLRAGGKHNDLENVGFTARHHTFFEMMGNFSFGDYFKKEAITWAWELATVKFGMPADKLHVTVFRTDDEAYDIWHKVVGVPKERIYRFDEADNFWSAGDVGPCGPCTEIYFDRGEKFMTGKPDLDRMGGDGGRYLEFYNLVFMQFNRDASGKMSPLPKPSVDTGLGLERTASILQDVPSNYDIDVFQSVIEAICNKSAARYVPDMGNETSSAIRVVADHLRAVSFLIADGVLPANEGRGYVLRRILRRAVRYGKKLGFTGPFMESLVPSLVQSMGAAYPELKERQAFIREAVKAEEEKFFQTLERGLEILNSEMSKLTKGQKIPGAVAFLLYDSFGFPLDLTNVVAKEKNIEVDEKAFETAMEKQRAQSRAAQDGDGPIHSHDTYDALAKKLKPTHFTGYENHQDEGKLIALLQDGKEVQKITTGSFEAIFDKSPFYGESGGQVGDSGEIHSKGAKVALVKDVKKGGSGFAVVKGLIEGGTLEVGQAYMQLTKREIRLKIKANHTATHLLHWALRKVLGTHVKQAGSLVSAELLRFDFTHFKAMSEAEKTQIEDMINDRIADAQPLKTKLMTKDEAISGGAMALFGEKYDAEVRVVSIGDGYSTELCGGTHVDNTAQIGCFVMVSEAGVAAGVRRITAYTSTTAVNYLKAKANALDLIKDSLKATSAEDTVAKVERLQAGSKELERKISGMQAEQAGGLAKDLVAKAKKLGGTHVVIHHLKDGGAEGLKTLGERLKDHLPSGVIVIGTTDAATNKAFLQVQVTGDLTKTYNAGKLIQAAAPLIDGKGGGKPEQAQAGGTKLAGLADALAHIESLLSSLGI
jgi:alanyl-tRNA synthetase